MACAWHRQVRRADARRSQARATKKTTRTTRKTKPKARRRGAVPAEPLGIGRGKINSRKASIRQRYYSLYGSN